MSVKFIVFDFDGTIADTYPAFVRIVNRLSGEFGYQPVSEEELTRLKHLSSREIIQQSEVPFWKLPFLLRKATSELGKEITQILPIAGIEKVFYELKTRDLKLGILTSNLKKNVRGFIEKNRLVDYFDFIDSGTGIFRKDKAIRRVLKRYQIEPQSLIYVGDETRDIEAAKKSQIEVVAVAWGFNSPEVLAQHQPSVLVHSPQELVEAIDHLRSLC